MLPLPAPPTVVLRHRAYAFTNEINALILEAPGICLPRPACEGKAGTISEAE